MEGWLAVPQSVISFFDEKAEKEMHKVQSLKFLDRLVLV
jgi:hypothetical protein